ncbi:MULTISPECIES: DUF4365 domain-containing protein [unclassified Tenacibaculum]|uniref:DUF4365 domain-containing protein n=1 Tax=unclassified Tenacibaculum TaxID=2635139 RepID=UPI001F4772A5|nr:MULTISPECIES: DUF4365 domain-containing protein [unclassified Tenacibaculum]MCF2875387.1 DUF4365 domain-containing protein [Tenacibaculum sp. Cn5-1]MCF2935463.1 DUF4365 domain-containing protein [Tenacibaculum sp. Cn5-34]MCG7512023.1 DUF4365 domain-containing protein [Tenacibaculum sp. Cn5-46]
MAFNKEERIGVFSVAKIFVEDFEWIFREQPVNDFGIDAFVEITKRDHPLINNIIPTGRLIGLQIKSGESFFSEEKNDHFIYRGNKKHLNYWSNHSIPVILILYDKSNNSAYWQEINQNTITLTKKAFKLPVPKSNLLTTEFYKKLEDIGYFKNEYGYRLWLLRSSVEVMKAATTRKYFLYVQLYENYYTKDYHVEVLMSPEDDDFITKVFHKLFHSNFENFYSFHLKSDGSITDNIKKVIPWIDLFYNGTPFSDKVFSNNVVTYIKDFADDLKIRVDSPDEKSIYEMACQITGEYYFKLEVNLNELAFNFLRLNDFLTTKN